MYIAHKNMRPNPPIYQPKKNTTMVEPFARTSRMSSLRVLSKVLFIFVNRSKRKLSSKQANRAFGTDSCHEVLFCHLTKLDLLFLNHT